MHIHTNNTIEFEIKYWLNALLNYENLRFFKNIYKIIQLVAHVQFI